MTMCFIPFLFIVGLIRRRQAEAAVVRAASLASKATGIPAFRKSLPEFAREFARARRHQRPLAVAVLCLGSDQLAEQMASLIGEPGNGSVTSRMQLLGHTTQLVSFALGSILRDVLRESDIVTYGAADDRYVVLLTDSNESQAQQVVQRLNELFYKRMSARLRAGIAVFPTDGLTLEELVSSAQAACHPRPIGDFSLQCPPDRDKKNGAPVGCSAMITAPDPAVRGTAIKSEEM
jgi:hypothetical protein